MKINIKGNEFTLKYSFRAFMMYENIAEKTIELNTLTDILTFFYCVVCSSNRDVTLSFDDFIDWVDDNSSSIMEFHEWVLKEMTKSNMLKKSQLEPKKKAKK